MSEKTLKEIVRTELYKAKLNKHGYYRYLSGVIRGAGELHFTPQGFALEIQHTDERLVLSVRNLVEKLYGVTPETGSNVKNVGYTSDRFYSIVIPQEISTDLLDKAKIVKNKYTFTQGIPESFIKNEDDKRVYLRGLYLACGAIRVPDEKISGSETKKSTGYTLSFNLNSDLVKEDVIRILCSEAQIESVHVRKKKEGSGIYLKDSEAICSVLTAMGCNEAPLKIYQIVVARKMLNDLNRARNCDVANIDKTVKAVARQIEAIEKLKENGEYASLSRELKETCEMRLKHPELGIEQLGAEFTPPLTKSCINHRFRRVVELAFGEKEQGKNKA